MSENNPLLRSETAYRSLEEKQFKAEMELFDRYQSFSAELLRLSLGGIVVVGFLFKEVHEINEEIRWSLLCFGSAAAFALIYRYALTEGFRFYLEGLRFEADSETSNSKLRWRHFAVWCCIISKAASVLALGLGAVVLSFGFFYLKK